MSAGDEFIPSTTLYGGTVNQFDVTFRKVGINPVFVNIGDHDAIGRAITPRTKCIFAETLGNPKIDVLDIEAVSAIAHKNGIPLVVDNTFAKSVLLPANRLGRGYRPPLGHQVYLRARHDNGRRHRRCWSLSMEQRKVPGMTEPSKGYHNLRFFEYLGISAGCLRCAPRC